MGLHESIPCQLIWLRAATGWKLHGEEILTNVNASLVHVLNKDAHFDPCTLKIYVYGHEIRVEAHQWSLVVDTKSYLMR